jgi:hypothetical protein
MPLPQGISQRSKVVILPTSGRHPVLWIKILYIQSTDLQHPNTTYFLFLYCFSHIFYIFWDKVGHSIVKRFWTHCTKNSKQIFPEMKLRVLSPNFYFHVSVSDLYIPMIGLPILLYCIVDRSWEYISGSQIHAFTAHTSRSLLRRQIFIHYLFLCTNYL